MRDLVLVLGDQLDADSAAFDGFDAAHDAVWMAEVARESTKVWSTKPRIAMFLAAMRHFRDLLRGKGWKVHYRELPANVPAADDTFAAALRESLTRPNPQRVVRGERGEWSPLEEIRTEVEATGKPLELREDRHFLCSRGEFRAHAGRKKQLRLEFFYREMRQRHGVLMDHGKPEGGAWNFDSENRKSFGRDGPPLHFPPRAFSPDAITREVIALVNRQFVAHPGDLSAFDWPVTAADAEAALQDFIARRLDNFGDWQDAMWSAEPWLFHSRLSAAMNLKLLNPRRVIAAAEEAYRAGTAPLASVEGFIRQILGWREYVRGVYWHFMPGYLERNALGADQPLPRFYWTGDTPMVCLRETIQQTLRLGYAHHIQRLMITGLYALLLGARPREVHEWYLAVYVDAVEWVELPNVLGMSQHADGGIMGSKPYAATGKYIQRMSNYCNDCRYNPAESVGPKGCPFTTLYWDFLLQHEESLRKNPRMVMQLRNIARLSPAKRKAIQDQAVQIRMGGTAT